MRRLHVKIFLAFWLGVIVVSVTLVTLTELMHSRAEDDRRWQEKYGPRVDLWARQETSILRTGGSAALVTYVTSFEVDPGVVNYILDSDGHDVLGRQTAPEVLRVVSAMSRAPAGTQRVDSNERIIAEKIDDGRGNLYVVVVDFPGPSILNRSLFEFFSEDTQTRRLVAGSTLRLVAVLIVAGVFSFVLARHIASPIDLLRSAARRISDGQLQTRADRSVLHRRDELADLGRDFDRMAERIERLVTAQRQLLADVSHALRSPLSRLNVALGLARQRGERAMPEHLDRIEREAERLNALIGQLLTMARVDSGADIERQTVFDLGTVVDEVAVDAEYEGRGKGCTVQFDPHGECLVKGAREMLRGAVENVVRNAVRHTAPNTRVEIHLDHYHHADGSDAIIQVRDHGPGVPADSVGSLFTPFHRIVNGPGENAGGTGLGLAITKRTFEVHGGSAAAANASDGGFVVTLELPLCPDNIRIDPPHPSLLDNS